MMRDYPEAVAFLACWFLATLLLLGGFPWQAAGLFAGPVIGITVGWAKDP